MQLLKLALVAIVLAACLTATGQQTDSGSQALSSIMATHRSQWHRLTDARCHRALAVLLCLPAVTRADEVATSNEPSMYDHTHSDAPLPPPARRCSFPSSPLLHLTDD